MGTADLLEVEGAVVEGLVVVGLVHLLPQLGHGRLGLAPVTHTSTQPPAPYITL